MAVLAALGAGVLDLAPRPAMAGAAAAATAPGFDGRQLLPGPSALAGVAAGAPTHGPGAGAGTLAAGPHRTPHWTALSAGAVGNDPRYGADVGAAQGRAPPVTTGT